VVDGCTLLPPIGFLLNWMGIRLVLLTSIRGFVATNILSMKGVCAGR
jgi:hypothetical protein